MKPPLPDFRTLVDAHQERVRNTCYRFVRNAEDADDLAQEVFVQVYTSLAQFRSEAELSTWIYRIAVNTSLDFLRRRNRKKRFARLLSLDEADDGAAEATQTPDNPHAALEEKEQQRLLEWAVAQLRENQRAAFVLSRDELLSNKEIAAIMDMSVPAVEALLHRARVKLQALLRDYFSGHA